ncbi:MAG: S41 family peptidase [Chitinispirillia bacterium]|nr:S41 family peptidase [Chitinispirillia bacterium]
MKFNIKKIFFALTASLLLTSCISPIYDGDTDLSEQRSVWQYLSVYSLYHDRLPKQLGGETPEDLFVDINDYFDGARYTEYASARTGRGMAAALETQKSPYTQFAITDSTAYLRISDFMDPSYPMSNSPFSKESVSFLERYQNIIIDLRGNLGGSIDVCEYIVSEFLPFNSGYIQYEYREYDRKNMRGRTVPWETQRTVIRNPRLTNKNIAVLMNHNSASASEILISALKDEAGAVLIGSTTSGKGIGQSHISRMGRKSLKITSMKIRGLTERTGEYHETGIEPDPIEDDIWEEVTAQEPNDPNLEYAVMILERSVSASYVNKKIKENSANLPAVSSMAKIAPIGAFVVLEDPLSD